MYCLNHPYRTRELDPIPVGPLLKAEAGPDFEFRRIPWKPSPDTEEIRLHLLDLLGRAGELFANDYHPAFGETVRLDPDYVGVVIWQLREFGERRAVPGLRGCKPALASSPISRAKRSNPLAADNASISPARHLKGPL